MLDDLSTGQTTRRDREEDECDRGDMGRDATRRLSLRRWKADHAKAVVQEGRKERSDGLPGEFPCSTAWSREDDSRPVQFVGQPNEFFR
jgi:hypothetical protein